MERAMVWLSWLFLESLPGLAALLGTILFVLLVYWRRTGQARPLLVGLGAALLLLGAQKLVVTPREHADRILAAIERDIVAGRTDALEAAIADDFVFGAEEQGGAEFIELVEAQMERVRVRFVDRWWLKREEGDSERTLVHVAYQAGVVGRHDGTFPTGWRLEFVRRPGGWKIRQIECTNLAGMENPGWGLIRRL